MSFQPIPEIVNGLPNISGHDAEVEAATSAQRGPALSRMGVLDCGQHEVSQSGVPSPLSQGSAVRLGSPAASTVPSPDGPGSTCVRVPRNAMHFGRRSRLWRGAGG